MNEVLYFIGPNKVEIRVEPSPIPGAGEVLVETILSAISHGTETLVYSGMAPKGVAADETISALEGDLSFPLKYGYAAVGRVVELGEGVSESWLDQEVFSFQPHQSHFVAPVDMLLPLPPAITPAQAVFLPNMETAVNFLMDGAPVIGERAVVLGQGIVGLLTTALLAQFPLENLAVFDSYPNRRRAAKALGAHAALAPGSALQKRADLVFELTGAPTAVDAAIQAAGYDGRVVIGSWYGQKRAPVDLGGYFHRSRIRLISSQVSTIAPQYTGRWTKDRRFSVAWEMIRAVKPEKLITHRFPLARAAEAYSLIANHPGETIQVVFDYSH